MLATGSYCLSIAFLRRPSTGVRLKLGFSRAWSSAVRRLLSCFLESAPASKSMSITSGCFP